MSYRAPTTSARAELTVKKSRFIGIVSPATSEEAVERARGAIASEFPGATHHCWAYVLGDPASRPRMRADDAGEPSGTAGRPILNVLRQRELGDALIVVVRYFGGIKLGAGGLVRAYSSAASQAVDAVPLGTAVPHLEASLTLDYGDEDVVRRCLAALDVETLDAHYGETIRFRIRLPRDRCDDVAKRLRDASRGRVRWERVRDPGPGACEIPS